MHPRERMMSGGGTLTPGHVSVISRSEGQRAAGNPERHVTGSQLHSTGMKECKLTAGARP